MNTVLTKATMPEHNATALMQHLTITHNHPPYTLNPIRPKRYTTLNLTLCTHARPRMLHAAARQSPKPASRERRCFFRGGGGGILIAIEAVLLARFLISDIRSSYTTSICDWFYTCSSLPLPVLLCYCCDYCLLNHCYYYLYYCCSY